MNYYYILLSVVFIIIIFSIILAVIISKYFINVPWISNTEPGTPLSKNRLPPVWGGEISDPYTDFDLPYENVNFISNNDHMLYGWLIEAKQYDVEALVTPSSSAKSVLNHNPYSHIGIVAVHGAGRDRRAWMRHTPLFYKRGLSVLLFDLSGHGQSQGVGKGVSYGARETYDVLAACKFMKEQRGYEKIVIVGTSTGATSAILSASKFPEFIDLIIAENPYGDPIYVFDHVVFNLIPSRISKLVKYNIPCSSLFQMLWKCYGHLLLTLGVWRLIREHAGHDFHDGEIICADKVVGTLKQPILFMHARGDILVPFEQSEQLYKLTSEPKDIWIVAESGHTALYNDYKHEYERKIFKFIEKHFTVLSKNE